MKVIVRLFALLICFSAYAGGADKEESVFSVGFLINATQRYGTSDIQKSNVQSMNGNDNQFFIVQAGPLLDSGAIKGIGDSGGSRAQYGGLCADLVTNAYVNGFYGLLIDRKINVPRAYLMRPKLYPYTQDGKTVNASLVDAILITQGLDHSKKKLYTFKESRAVCGSGFCSWEDETVATEDCSSGICKGSVDCTLRCTALRKNGAGTSWYTSKMVGVWTGSKWVSVDKLTNYKDQLTVTFASFESSKDIDKRLYFSGGIAFYKNDSDYKYTYQKGIFLPVMMFSKSVDPVSMNNKPVNDLIQNFLSEYSYKEGNSTQYEW